MYNIFLWHIIKKVFYIIYNLLFLHLVYIYIEIVEYFKIFLPWLRLDNDTYYRLRI